MPSDLTVVILKELLTYDHVSGVFIWNAPRQPRINAGDRAGTLNPSGYRNIVINGVSYKEHRLAWLYVHGVWPVHLDHIDGNAANNSLSNLREATRSQNLANSRRRKDNSSGFKGVYFERTTGKWMAIVTHQGTRHYLGLFQTPELAHQAYSKKAVELQGQFARVK